MFSPALGRVVRSTCSISSISPVCTASRPAAVSFLGAKQSLCRQPKHQRRLSSSKASIPPNDSGMEAEPEESLRKAQGGPAKRKEKKAAADAAKPSAKVANPAQPKQTPAPRNIPHVPALDYLKQIDAQHANFYSLHRPTSITDTLPAAKPDGFDSIFEKKKPSSVFFSGVDTIDDAVARLDINSVQEELSRIPPFHPPPLPVARSTTDLTAQQHGPSSKKSWSTNIVFTETTHASGQRTIYVSAAPMVEVPNPAVDASEQQPFLTRMMHREREMQLISVKRQRRLKMKKHKYKKLMKKTRLERRKLDRK